MTTGLWRDAIEEALVSGLAITDFSVARHFDLFAAGLQRLTPSSFVQLCAIGS